MIHRFLTASLAAVALCASATGAAAQGATLPSMKSLTAPLVSPAAGETFYGAATTHTSSFAGVSGFEGQPPEIVETARALKNNPDLIYEFVRNQVRVEYAFGVRKGPLAALIDKSGTPFDQNVLFVNLVRQAGLPARYQIGRVTMTGADFASWTGVSDLQAACRLLSSGGVPAAFNGAASTAADCAISGTFTSVTFLHVWSQVQIGGTWYAYDPSIKSLKVATPRNLVTGSGLVAGQAATQAASTIDTGTASGSTYIHNASQANLDTYLTARGTQLLTDVATNAPDQDTDTVVGVRKIIPAYMPAGGWRNATPPGYTTGTSTTITGDIPDQYRATLNVTVSAVLDGVTNSTLINKLFYADDIGGRRVGLSSNFRLGEFNNPVTGSSTPQTYRLNVDDVVVSSFTCTASLPIPAYPCPLGQGGSVSLAVTHPYAANGGTYGAQTMVKTISTLSAPFAIVNGWGWVSPQLLAKWSTEVAEDDALPTRGSSPLPCGTGEFCWERFNQSAENFTRQRLAASWLAQASRMLDLQAEVGGATADHQHTIGVVDWRANFTTYQFPAPPDPTSKTYFGIGDQFTELNIDTAVSITSRSNDAAKTNAIFRSTALASATLEGSVLEQMENLPDAASTASRFAWGNQPDNEDPCFAVNNPRRFFDLTASTAPNRSNIYQYEGSASGCSAFPEIIGADPTTWKNNQEQAVSGYLAAGFRVIASAESFLGPGSRFGPGILQGNSITRNRPSRQRGAALVATKVDGGGRVTEIAHILTTLDGVSKGGGGKQPERFTEYDPKKAADILKDRFVDRSVALGVDLKTGTVGYTTPTLLSVGGEDAPYGLTYSRTFKNAFEGCSGRFGPCTSGVQGGWTHNWDLRFSTSGSAMEALGETSPRAAAGSLVAFLAMQDIFTSSGRTELEKDVYAALAADWWRRQMVNNVATVTQGFSGKQYVRMVNNAWLPPIGSPGVLTQTGARAKVRDQCTPTPISGNSFSTSRRWNFAGVTYSLRNAAGDVMTFSPWDWNYDPDNQCAIAYGYKPMAWTYPQGPSLSFTYDFEKGVTAVATSLGRTMTIVDGVATVGTRSAGVTAGGVRDASNGLYKFDIGAALARSATQRPIPYGQLKQVFEPVNGNAPALKYVYDSRGLVLEASDATALQWQTRGAYSWYIAEGGRGERDDPAGGAYTVYFDTDGDPVRNIDELGRETVSVFDGRHRVTSRTYPETDRDQFSYDANDNVISLTRVPKTGSPLVNIAIQASYDPTWNKLSWIRDGLLRQTDFTYYASGSGASLLQQVQRPAVGGVRPTYSFQYNAIGLPTQSVDPTGVTTTNVYDGLGNLTSSTLATAAVGANPALNLTTLYVPDAVGNVVTLTSPRSYATTTQYDAMRRKTDEQNRNGNATAVPLAAKHWVYDANGRMIQEGRAATIDGSGVVTSWQTWLTGYTPTGQTASLTDPSGQATRTLYDPLDRPRQMFDAQGRVTQFNYDLAGQKAAELRGVGSPLQQTYATYAYTLNGQQDWVQDAGGGRTDFTYDGFDRLSQTNYPTPSTGLPNASDFEALTYDAQSNVLTRRTRGAATLVMTYDALDRVSTKAVPAWGAGSARTATYGYDLAGRRTSLVEAGQTLGWTYDAAGREITATINGPLWAGGAKTVSTAYNLNSVRNRLTWPDGYYVQYVYDGMDRPIQALENGSTLLASWAPNPLSQVTAESRPNGTISRTFNLKGDPITLGHVWSGTNLNFTYGYDRSRKLTSKTVNLAAYALAGPASASTAYVPDKLNRYASVAGASFSYDTAGNLTSDGSSTFTYDAENRLLTSATPLGSGAYTYDPLGRRVGKGIGGGAPTVVLPAGDDEIGAYNSAGVLLRRWLPSPEIDRLIAQVDIAAATTTFYRQDRQGSTIAMTNAAGGLAEGPYTYDGYGKPNVTTGTPFRFNGRKYDAETGLYYYRARYYSPSLGRFLQTDPSGYADQMNLYTYVYNSPLNFADPYGDAGVFISASVKLQAPSVTFGGKTYSWPCAVCGSLKIGLAISAPQIGVGGTLNAPIATLRDGAKFDAGGFAAAGRAASDASPEMVGGPEVDTNVGIGLALGAGIFRGSVSDLGGQGGSGGLTVPGASGAVNVNDKGQISSAEVGPGGGLAGGLDRTVTGTVSFRDGVKGGNSESLAPMQICSGNSNACLTMK